MAVSVPIYYATANKSKAFWYSFCLVWQNPWGHWLDTCC